MNLKYEVHFFKKRDLIHVYALFLFKNGYLEEILEQMLFDNSSIIMNETNAVHQIIFLSIYLFVINAIMIYQFITLLDRSEEI